MKNLFLFFVCIILFVNGCNENPTEDLTSDFRIIKKIIESSKGYTEFSYERSLLTKKENKTSDGQVTWSISFTYDEENRLIAKDVFSPLSRAFYISNSIYEYSDSDLIQKENIYWHGDLDTYILYEYLNNKITKYSYYSPNDELSGYHTLKYENGNIIEDAYFDRRDSLIILEVYEYDDKINPLNVDLSPISASSYSRNNITHSIETSYTNTPPNIYTTLSTYTYDKNDYPIKNFVEYVEYENGMTSQDTSTTFYEYIK